MAEVLLVKTDGQAAYLAGCFPRDVPASLQDSSDYRSVDIG